MHPQAGIERCVHPHRPPKDKQRLRPHPHPQLVDTQYSTQRCVVYIWLKSKKSKKVFQTCASLIGQGKKWDFPKQNGIDSMLLQCQFVYHSLSPFVALGLQSYRNTTSTRQTKKCSILSSNVFLLQGHWRGSLKADCLPMRALHVL